MLDWNMRARFQLAIINNHGKTNTRRILSISGSNNQSTVLKMRGIWWTYAGTFFIRD